MAEPEIPEEFLGDYARILAEVSATGRRLTRDELETRRALGREAAEAGHQLRALVRLHLSATRTTWPSGTSGGSAAATDSVLAAVEQAVADFAEQVLARRLPV